MINYDTRLFSVTVVSFSSDATTFTSEKVNFLEEE
jgi:hypothetical protein